LKILLDSSFVRHLESTNNLELIPQIQTLKKWTFIIPQIVQNELEVGGISNHLSDIISQIQEDCCNDDEFDLIKSQFMGLDDGELEAICIINQCEDRTFQQYLLLTDDHPAQRRASELGMNSLDTLMFLQASNEMSLLTKDDAITSMTILEEIGFRFENGIKSDYMNRLK